MQRINYLDGHRGVAILLVIFYHAFSRWLDITPYQASYSEFPLFKYGFLGVQLFFLLSGYVILMTLEKCKAVPVFLYRRWLRLFPAMLICSLIILYSAPLLPERPLGNPRLSDVIPGLIFIEPYLLSKVSGIDFSSLEGAFWSLYVEFKFYIIASCLYFAVGGKKLVIALLMCLLSWSLLHFSSQLFDSRLLTVIYSICHLLSFEYFGWFSAGAAFYIAQKESSSIWFYAGICISIVSSVILGLQKDSFAVFSAIIILSLFFAMSLKSSVIQSILSHRFLVFLGFVSYPLYLLHENMMLAITIKFSHLVPVEVSFILPIVAVSFIATISYIVVMYIEKPVKQLLSLEKLNKYK